MLNEYKLIAFDSNLVIDSFKKKLPLTQLAEQTRDSRPIISLIIYQYYTYTHLPN
jgi:hypothetical protein